MVRKLSDVAEKRIEELKGLYPQAASAVMPALYLAQEELGSITAEAIDWVAERLAGDVELVNSICSQIQGRTICAFGEALSWPAQAFIKRFPEEFRTRIEEALRGAVQPRPSMSFEYDGHHGEVVSSPWGSLRGVR